MTMTKNEFKEITKLIMNLFPKEGITFSKAMAEAWYEALQDLDYKDARVGLMKYAQTSQWFPTIADIRKNSPQSIFKSKFGITDEEFHRQMEKHMGIDEW